MTTRVRSLAIESIADRLALADFEERQLIPPTELYGKGWMLRLVLEAARNSLSRSSTVPV